jgi:DedD protein
MPSDTTAEQVDLRRKARQRLIGAITLALIAAVFVPMVLDPEPRQQRVEPALAIPPRDNLLPLAPAAALPAPAVDAAASIPPPSPPAKDPPAPAEQPAAPEPRKTVEPRAAEFKAAPEKPSSATQAEAKGVAAKPKLEGFAVQVGAFKEEAKLAQAREKLSAARLPHYTERLQTASGDLTRLRAGPYPTREAAEKAAAEVKRAGLGGRVVPLP